MREELLHYIWRSRQLIHFPLLTTKGEEVILVRPGNYNTHAGPDFLDARIKIGDQLWAGHVEMHLKSSDWIQHQHQNDPAYQNVILHVVLEEDIPIKNAAGGLLPCLELKKHIPNALVGKYLLFQQQENWIPCQHFLPDIPVPRIQLWLDRLLIERLEQKTARLLTQLQKLNNDWETALYHSLAHSFGLTVNAETFQALAQSLPLPLIGKHLSSLLQLEALLFGQANMLEDEFEDTYPQKLQREYRFLKHKYQLQPIELPWKFMRLRPANFPSIRIAQFAAFLFQTRHLFSKLLAAHSVKELENLFDLQLSLYWKTHYRFDAPSKKRTKKTGVQFRRLVIINTFIPFLFAYAKARILPQYQEKALRFLEAIPAERNAVLRKFEHAGMPKVQTAYQSQALLQLRKAYCQQQNCLNCAIGHQVLKKPT